MVERRIDESLHWRNSRMEGFINSSFNHTWKALDHSAISSMQGFIVTIEQIFDIFPPGQTIFRLYSFSVSPGAKWQRFVQSWQKWQGGSKNWPFCYFFNARLFHDNEPWMNFLWGMTIIPEQQKMNPWLKKDHSALSSNEPNRHSRCHPIKKT